MVKAKLLLLCEPVQVEAVISQLTLQREGEPFGNVAATTTSQHLWRFFRSSVTSKEIEQSLEEQNEKCKARIQAYQDLLGYLWFYSVLNWSLAYHSSISSSAREALIRSFFILKRQKDQQHYLDRLEGCNTKLRYELQEVRKLVFLKLAESVEVRVLSVHN